MRSSALASRITMSSGPEWIQRSPTSGAPVFSSDWELVAIHEGVLSHTDRSVKRGVPMAPIIERLRAKGIL